MNDGGKILFNEFCEWAIKAGLDLDNDPNDLMEVPEEKQYHGKATDNKAPAREVKVDWELLAEKLPYHLTEKEH